MFDFKLNFVLLAIDDECNQLMMTAILDKVRNHRLTHLVLDDCYLSDQFYQRLLSILQNHFKYARFEFKRILHIIPSVFDELYQTLNLKFYYF